MLSVNAELPVGSLNEFIRYANENRGRLSIAFDTTAGAAAFAAKLLNKRLDLGLIEVPYRSAAQMTQDVHERRHSGDDQLPYGSPRVIGCGRGSPPRRHFEQALSRLPRSAVAQ